MNWTEYEDDRLTDLLFETSFSVNEIARNLDRPQDDVSRRIRSLGLTWVKKKKGHSSRGEAALTEIMKKLIPNADVVNEEHIGHRLRLDVYCPKYKLAAEYHGRQHFYYVPFFHPTKEDFYEAQERDEKKLRMCKDLGITLVTFRYSDSLTEDIVFNRLLDGLRNSEAYDLSDKKGGPPTYKGNPYYESAKERQREYRKLQYQKMKAKRGRG